VRGASGAGCAAKLRRTWPQRLLIAFNSVLVVICLASAWAFAYYGRQISNIPRVPLQGVLDRQENSSMPVNFLLLGSDSSSDPGRFGLYNADSISILRVDPTEHRASLLSLPRDLWIQLPNRSGRHKLNAALANAQPPGDPELLIRVIQERFRIPVHHFVQVDFAAFRSLVDQVGGVNLWFDAPTQDHKIGLYIDEPGCRLASGDEALRFARAREYKEMQADGSWRVDPTNDIGRIARQQYFLKQAAKKAIARGARNPVELANLLGTALDQKLVRLDDTLSPQRILDLVGHMSAYNPDDLEVSQPFTRRQVYPGPGGDGLALLEAESEPIFTRFRDSAPAPAAAPGPVAAGPVTSAPSTIPDRSPPSSLAAATTDPAVPDAGSFVPNPPPGVAC
jgi:LCP family protein required for cell wall assembly